MALGRCHRAEEARLHSQSAGLSDDAAAKGEGTEPERNDRAEQVETEIYNPFLTTATSASPACGSLFFFWIELPRVMRYNTLL